ncbi:TetR family transcriptional regulator [Branchiibius hedensis]|uniref:DNA-binding transcriptional regulator YbjK n=1 Tax=Branchiibius hedensis TaxID=672460 RepID=A0A2Y8ZUE4_9MICO|nr:TetR family transcriptional regulator [Branchiibius hedensis]PWJ26086.1 TetR family transcriptional regulator [Branchiibius hedensis]SSA34898.1 DNA-binding transcriptional regulator YbjK [Branchiibius hedensis]
MSKSLERRRAARGRRSRPEGTAARQLHLLESAAAVVAEQGLRGLTHRAVDREAGLPEGTCSVYYRTRLALLTALTEHVGAHFTSDVAAMGEGFSDEQILNRVFVVNACTKLLHGWTQDATLVIAMGELSFESLRKPTLAPAANHWREMMAFIVETIIERMGISAPQMRAKALVSSLEGIVVSSMKLQPAAREGYLRHTIGILVLGILNLDAADVAALDAEQLQLSR